MRDEVGEQLAEWGKVARLVTTGRVSGRPVIAAVGFVEEPDGTFLVAAGGPETGWARNLEAVPTCLVEVEDRRLEVTAEPLAGAVAARAVRELILKYGTPAERLGRGPAFRLRPATPAR